MTDDSLALDLRTGLPDALRALLEAFPREVWEAHPNFAGLVEFWLGRHQMFRQIMAALTSEAEALVDGRLAPDAYAPRLARYGSLFVNELHGHHQIEDRHYFPVLARAEAPLAQGFALLDADHHAIDLHLDRFAKGANAILGAERGTAAFRDRTGRFLGDLRGIGRALDRHLLDEEDLVVPVILRHGPDAIH